MFSDILFERQLNINNQNFYKKKLIHSCFKKTNYLYKTAINENLNRPNTFKFSKDGNFIVTTGFRKFRICNLNENNSFPFFYEYFDLKSFIENLALNNDFTTIFGSTFPARTLDLYDTKTGLFIKKIDVDARITDITNCPKNFNLVTFACQNKKLYIYDSRIANKTKEIFQHNSFINSIQYHPVKDYLILLASKCKKGIFNFDLRNQKLTNNYILPYVNEYGVNNAKYNREGNQIVITRKRFNPLVYNTNNNYPLYEFSEEGYYNLHNTPNNCCFCGPDDEFILAASANCSLYVWEIPKIKPHKISSNVIERVNSVNFILKGSHNFINTVDYNYQKTLIASSCFPTFEILFWSPFLSNTKINSINFLKKHKDCNFSVLDDITSFIKEHLLTTSSFDEKKNLNIHFIKSKNLSYNKEEKVINSNLLIKFKKLLEKINKNQDSNIINKTIYIEAQKVFDCKRFYESSIFYLKKELDQLKSLEKKLELKSIIIDLKNIIQQNKKLYEYSFDVLNIYTKKKESWLFKNYFEISKEIFVNDFFLEDDIEKINEKMNLKKIQIFSELSFSGFGIQ